MLTREFSKATAHPVRPSVVHNCDYCGEDAEITMTGYGDDYSGNCHWCADCAMQLARKILEDLCELKTKGGRHG
jgi:hypothetical protein